MGCIHNVAIYNVAGDMLNFFFHLNFIFGDILNYVFNIMIFTFDIHYGVIHNVACYILNFSFSF